MAQKIVLKSEGKEFTVNVGDRFKFIEYRELPSRAENKTVIEDIEIVKASTKKGELLIKKNILASTYMSQDGTCNNFGYTQDQLLSPYNAETGNGIRIIDANTYEHYSDFRLTYKAIRLQAPTLSC